VFRPVGAFFTGLVNIGSLQEENRRLHQQVDQLQQETGQAASTQRELDRLLALYDLQQALGLNGVAAVVIAQSVGNFEWTVNVNRGSSEGIRTNMPVVAGEGLVGHVIQVAPHWSKVQLIVDPESAVAGRLVSSGETGLIVGQRDRDLTMDLDNPDANVLPEEQVVTSGYQGGLYPPEIVVGFVSHVFRDPARLTKVIAVRPAVDFSSLEFVLVVTGK
jgi:rod shape-determining protein MreC